MRRRRRSSVADLFSGIGPFALRLAERARVLAVDDDEAALAALKRAAATTAGLKPVEVERRDLFRRPLAAAELKRFDAVVFDPPRQGAQAQARELAASNVPLDRRGVVQSGHVRPRCERACPRRLSALEVTPVDQFRYSPHVEIVARLEK